MKNILQASLSIQIVIFLQFVPKTFWQTSLNNILEEFFLFD
jgi:hypothetical protein